MRTTLTIDFDVEEGTDPGKFGDELIATRESMDVHDAVQNNFPTLVAVSIETVRDVGVEPVDD
jgi:hypothetical protein